MQPPRSRVPWALAVTVGLCSGLAGYVIHAAMTRRAPKQVVTVRRLTNLPGAAVEPAISPDGKMVAFVALSGGRRQVWIQQIPGGTPRVITRDDADHAGPRWTPNAQHLTYFASGSIWEVSAGGGQPRKLADALGPADLSHQSGSPAFFRHAVDGIELVVRERAIAKLTGGQSYLNLRWSLDDNKIAYLQDQTVMVIASSGGEPVRAANISIQGFAWTPDNSGLIASVQGELWFIPRVEGRQPSQLTFGELSYESPDMDAAGDVVVSRRGLAGQDADIVMFSGLRW